MSERRTRYRREVERRAAKPGVTTRVRDGADEPKRVRRGALARVTAAELEAKYHEAGRRLETRVGSLSPVGHDDVFSVHVEYTHGKRTLSVNGRPVCWCRG